MADLFDYLKWRGDLSFSVSTFNTIDALILCQLSYINFDDIIPQNTKETKTLNQVASEFATHKDFKTKSDLGLVINPKTIELLYAAAKSKRFGNILLCNYKDTYNPLIEEQFCAMTIIFDDIVFVAFRGTDDTIIGWKEDFNLAFKDFVPAQQEAVEYLTNVIDDFRFKDIFVGGHSKGGNLAIYSAANIKSRFQKKVDAVFNFDGPGFLEETLLQQNFSETLEKTTSVFPQGSIIGMLFKHQKEYSVVSSDGFFVMQHDPFTWKLDGPDFLRCQDLDRGSAFFHKIFNQWFVKLEKEKREEFVETLFDLLETTNAKTNSELTANWIKNSGKIMKAFSDLDPEIKKSTGSTIGEFFKLAKKSVSDKIIAEKNKFSDTITL